MAARDGERVSHTEDMMDNMDKGGSEFQSIKRYQRFLERSYKRGCRIFPTQKNDKW